MQTRTAITMELQLSPSGKAREPEVGVDLFDAPSEVAVPWKAEPAEKFDPAATLPLLLAELEERLEVEAPVPAPAPRAPVRDPFEYFLTHNAVSAYGLAPGAEPTIREPSPLGQVAPAPAPVEKPKRTMTAEQFPEVKPWWLEQSAPPEYVMAPVSDAAPAGPAARKNTKLIAKLSLAAVMVSLVASVGALGLTRQGPASNSAAELIAPLPPEARHAELVAAQVQAEEKQATVEAAAPRPTKMARAKNLRAKKWAEMNWPEPETVAAPAAVEAPAEEVAAEPAPAPAPVSDLKRPEF